MRLNRRKKFKIILTIISIILLIFIFLNSYLVIGYNVLPAKYLILYLVIVILIPLLIIYLEIFQRIKYRFKIFFGVIECLYIIILGIVFVYLNNTLDIINKFTNDYQYETKTYYVLALTDSSYSELTDLDGLNFGYNSSLDTSASSALSELKKEITLNENDYEDFTSLFTGLIDNEIECVLILDSFYDILEEDEDNDLTSETKIIYTFSIKEKIDSLSKDVDITSEVFNLYISGIDSYGSVTDNTRSDVNIVASINPNTHEILLINIPRDYYVELAGIGEYDKLTHAGIYGISTSIGTIENLLDIEINYYVKVNYNALVKLVNALDGVNVYSEYSFYSTIEGYYFTKGYNYVNGAQALDFVRTRKAFEDGDRVRGQNQEAMIEAILDKLSSATILLKYNELLETLDDSFTTNLSTSQIISLVNKQLDEMADWNITSISVNGTDANEYTYSYPSQKLYVMVPLEETIEEAKEALLEIASE